MWRGFRNWRPSSCGPLIERLGGSRTPCRTMQPSVGNLISQGIAWIAAVPAGPVVGRAGAARHLLPAGRDAGGRLLHARRLGPHGAARWIPGCPMRHRDTIRAIARDIDRAIAGFVRGQALVCLILGTFYAVSAAAASGSNFGALIGMTAGILSFIPYVGSLTGLILSVGVAIVQFWPDWTMIAATLGIFVFGQFVEGNILSPKLVGDSVGLHPVWLMFALLAFGVALRLRRPAAGGAARGRHRRHRPLRACASIWRARSIAVPSRRSCHRPMDRRSMADLDARRPSSSPSTCPSIPASAREDFLVSPSNEQAYGADRELARLARHDPAARSARAAAARAISPPSGRRTPMPGPSTRSRSRRTRSRISSRTARSPSRTWTGASGTRRPCSTCSTSRGRSGPSCCSPARRRRTAGACAPPISCPACALRRACRSDAPDDALLKAVLVKLFVDRQLVVDTTVVDYIALRIERSLAKAAELVALLDKEALEPGPARLAGDRGRDPRRLAGNG